jgi:zinc-ribbon domain
MYCTSCGKAVDAGAAFCGKCGAAVSGRRAQTGTGIVVQDVVRSQIAVGNGNVQVQVTVDGVSRITERDGGVQLRVREIPALPATSRPSLIGRDTLVEEACQALSGRTSVQLFGAPGVGRSAVAEAVLRRLAEAGTRCIEMRPATSFTPWSPCTGG